MKDKLNLNKSELLEYRELFHKHYKLRTGEKINDSITVTWSELYNVVQNKSGILQTNEIVLRFFHRWNESKWYLTMECCHIDDRGMIDFTANRFDITDFSITESKFEEQIDTSYQDVLTYDGQALQNLRAVRSVTFPWQKEFVEAAKVNNVCTDESVNLKFISISYNHTHGELVKYPHLLAMVFSLANNEDMINDEIASANGLIKPAKAFNMGNPCPPSCDLFDQYKLFFSNELSTSKTIEEKTDCLCASAGI